MGLTLDSLYALMYTGRGKGGPDPWTGEGDNLSPLLALIYYPGSKTGRHIISYYLLKCH